MGNRSIKDIIKTKNSGNPTKNPGFATKKPPKPTDQTKRGCCEIPKKEEILPKNQDNVLFYEKSRLVWFFIRP